MASKEGVSTLGVSRRDFLRIGVLASLAVLAMESVGAAIVSLWPRPRAGEARARIVVGRPSDFFVGSVTHFPEGGFFLSHVDSGFLALSQVCTHLGCITPWRPEEPSEDNLGASGRFNCPCHGSIFDRHGRVIVAPATRPLDLHPLSLDGDNLVVDVSTVIKRGSHEESQVLKV